MQQAPPEALQDDLVEIKSYSRSGNLVDEIYEEMVKDNPVLKKLEDDLDAIRSQSGDLTNQFQQYDNKSKNYYRIADNKASGISDSLLKAKIMSVISKSNEKYANKTGELNALLQQMAKNDASLNDHHAALKIVLTLPVMEKFQDDNKPGTKNFKDLVKAQEKLIIRTDSVKPAF